LKKAADYRMDYEGKTAAELKKIRVRLLIERSEVMGIFSLRRKKELEQRIAAVEELLESQEA